MSPTANASDADDPPETQKATESDTDEMRRNASAEAIARPTAMVSCCPGAGIRGEEKAPAGVGAASR
jgi:hypothetical protein